MESDRSLNFLLTIPVSAYTPAAHKQAQENSHARESHNRRETPCLADICLADLACRTGRLRESAGELSVTPASMARIGTIDERYQSYNIEMVEVTGGEFWKPYGPERGVEAAPPPNAPGARNSNKNSNLFQYRPPIDLTNARLRKLASALAPAYLRVSGTWANTTYFADSDSVPSAPPTGFKAILTRRQWREVIDFAHRSMRGS